MSILIFKRNFFKIITKLIYRKKVFRNYVKYSQYYKGHTNYVICVKYKRLILSLKIIFV